MQSGQKASFVPSEFLDGRDKKPAWKETSQAQKFFQCESTVTEIIAVTFAQS